jgi:hypothetical protein
MTTLGYIREMEADKESDQQRRREEEWDAECAWENDDEAHFAEIRQWAIKHGLLGGGAMSFGGVVSARGGVFQSLAMSTEGRSVSLARGREAAKEETLLRIAQKVPWLRLRGLSNPW